MFIQENLFILAFIILERWPQWTNRVRISECLILELVLLQHMPMPFSYVVLAQQTNNSFLMAWPGQARPGHDFLGHVLYIPNLMPFSILLLKMVMPADEASHLLEAYHEGAAQMTEFVEQMLNNNNVSFWNTSFWNPIPNLNSKLLQVRQRSDM